MIRILGLDPGLACTGYGIIDSGASRLVHVTHGVISTPADMATGERLLCIYDSLAALIDQYAPGEAGIENLFFSKNITSAIPVAQARGVALLLFSRRALAVGDYPPPVIKRAVVGYGRAEKHQVQELVRFLLGLKEIPRPDHAADALAAAICHAHTRGGVAEAARKISGKGKKIVIAGAKKGKTNRLRKNIADCPTRPENTKTGESHD
jgi:crossover junction endodeoxyribonuclease RuvC